MPTTGRLPVDLVKSYVTPKAIQKAATLAVGQGVPVVWAGRGGSDRGLVNPS